MKGKPVTDDEFAAMRMRLTAVALRLVDEEGREACSLRRVGAEAGISRMTPYSYFAHKEELLDAVRVAALHQLADRCEQALASGATVPERLAGVGSAYIAFALEHPRLYDLLFEPVARSKELLDAIARYRSLAEQPLREAHALGLTAMDPPLLGQVLWAATHGLVSLHRSQKLSHGVSFEELRKALGDVLAFGFVPRGGSVP